MDVPLGFDKVVHLTLKYRAERTGLTFSLQRTADGKIMATVTPAGSPPSFFLRVKVK